jgi:Endonuclease-reverse transcriptase
MSATPAQSFSDATKSDSLHILSVNMNRSNFKLTSLLQSSFADCILVQEPWWGPLVPKRSDTDPDSELSFGTVSHPAWTAFTPSISGSPDGHPRVITFFRKRLLASCSVTPIADLSFYDLIGLSLRSPSLNLSLINFYHHVQHHQGNLTHLLDFSPEAHTPVLLTGDFNTHSDTWSLGGKCTSPWAIPLETWLDDHGFISTIPDGAISRRSTTSSPSLIDFIFVNEPFLEVPSFPSVCSVSFGSSVGSDHAGLSISLPLSPLPPRLLRPPGWKIDPDLRAEWCSCFKTFPMPVITDKDSLLEAARNPIRHISNVSNALFPRRSPPTDRDFPWWSHECSIACAQLKSCHWRDRRHLSMVLRMTIHTAK